MEEVESKNGSYGVLVSLTVRFSSQHVCAVIILDHSCFMARDRCQQRPHPAQLFFFFSRCLGLALQRCGQEPVLLI